MLVLIYDHSLAGFLSAVFELYASYGYGKQGGMDVRIVKRGVYRPDLFMQTTEIETEDSKADRVLLRLEQLFGKAGLRTLVWAFLSESEEVELCLLEVITYAIQYPGLNVLANFAHPAVVKITRLAHSVGRERHRMLAFVRFEKLKDDHFFARIKPDYNVLPLISSHFRLRYQDQCWAIFDTGRKYGIYYDLNDIRYIENADNALLGNSDAFFAEDENNYQKLWQGYFSSVNISERANPKLHVRQLPKRYWPYLTEKKIKPTKP